MLESVLGIFALTAACVASIVGYGIYRCQTPEFQDPLTLSVAPSPWDKYVDGWGLTHFFFFMLLGVLYPRYWALIWSLGLAWEVIEFSSQSKPFYASVCHAGTREADLTGWWYGRWQDIVMNSSGLAVGVLLNAAGVHFSWALVLAVTVVSSQIIVVHGARRD